MSRVPFNYEYLSFEPKLIKGPDVFCDLVKRIKKKVSIHVLLTGPARGYVKKKLIEYNIPFSHVFLKDYREIVNYYNVLDLYLITSRSEGGPKALLEGMATGVPIVSTKVGMAPYIIKHGVNGFISDVDDLIYKKLLKKNSTIIFYSYIKNY